MYAWLAGQQGQAFDPPQLLKLPSRGSVSLLRHKTTGKRFILLRTSGQAEVYRKLLDVPYPHLPAILEVVTEGERHLILEEYVQGDNMGELLQGALVTFEEPRRIGVQLCRDLWVLHSLGVVHRNVKPENVILRGGGTQCSSTMTPPASTGRTEPLTPRCWKPGA